MAFLRNTNRDRFTVIDNYAVRDDSLSLKSLGLLVRLLSLPDNWEFSENGLEKIFLKDGQTSIRTGLKELEASGYLKRTRVRDKKGRMTRVEWLVSESPQFENRSVEISSMENHPQYNTDEQSTKGSITNTPPNPQTGEEKREPTPNEQKKKATASNSLGIDYEAFADTYNQTCKKLPSCKKMTDKRKKAIAKFLKEYTFEDWQKECELTAKSRFLCGASERGWRADFDWLLKIEKATKILEGGYQDNGNSTMFQGNKTSVRDYRERYEGDHGCEDEFDFGDE